MKKIFTICFLLMVLSFVDAQESVIRHWEFEANNAGYTIGVFNSNQTIGGESYQAHTQYPDFSRWQRISGPDAVILQNQGSYPVFGNPDNGYTAQFWYRRMDATVSSSENGFMLMSMQDQIAAWGGTGEIGVFHSYIQFEGVSTAEAGIVDVCLFQYYRKFNHDQCFIDYSFDNGSTWNTQEINVRGVDVSVNNSLLGNYTYTMPAAVSGKANVIFRIRWYSSDAGGGAYGYFWALDDFKVLSSPQSRMHYGKQNYVEGAYQLMPQGMSLPVSWAVNVINNGTIPQNNVQAKLFDENGGLIGSGDAQNFDADPSVNKLVGVDGLGWLADNNDANKQGWYGNCANRSDLIYGQVPTQRNNGYPTDVEGWHSVYARITTDSLEHTFDPISYLVNGLDEDGYAIWGVDNGVLARNQQFCTGYDDDAVYITEESHWYEAGYAVNVRYTTGSDIPEGWVIHGVEMVAATTPGAATAGRIISATLTRDSYDVAGILSFLNVNTGASPYTIQESDLNSSESISQAGNYKEFGEYNTIRIMFPEQPELEPYTSYRIGYRLENSGFFSVASANTGRYVVPNAAGDGDSAVYFRNDPATEKYSKTFAGANLGASIKTGYEVYVTDRRPFWAGSNTKATPMIRMIVGPRKEVERVEVGASVSTNDAGEPMAVVTWNGDIVTQENPAMVAMGSTAEFEIRPIVGYSISNIYLDGVLIEPFDEEEETGDERLRRYEIYDESGYLSGYGYVLTIQNINEPHQIVVGAVASGIFSVSASGVGGTVSGTGNYNVGDTVTLTAIPNAGYRFTGWSDGNTDNPRIFEMPNNNVNLTANFVEEAYYLVDVYVNNSQYGYVYFMTEWGVTYSPNDYNGYPAYDEGLVLTYYAVPNDRYQFLGWSNGVTDNPYTFQVMGDTTFTAIFGLAPLEITVVANDSTKGQALGSGIYDAFTTINIQAVPNENAMFVCWQDGNAENPREIEAIEDAIYMAIFANRYADTITLYDTTIVNNYIHDTTIVVDSIPYTVHDTTYIDVFIHDTTIVTVHDTIMEQLTYYTLTVQSSNATRGLVAGNGSFPVGTEVEIAAIPVEGNHFVKWNDDNTENPRRVTLTENATYVATFEQNDAQGVADVMLNNYSVSTREGMIVVKDAEGEQLRVFDVTGRLLHQGRIENAEWHVGVQSAGAYFVQVGVGVAQKVVVVK